MNFEQQYYVIKLYECTAPVVQDYTYMYLAGIAAFIFSIWTIFSIATDPEFNLSAYGKMKAETPWL